MINIDRVKKLIDQIPEIKALFRPQNFHWKDGQYLMVICEWL